MDVVLDGNSLSIEKIHAVARGSAKVSVSPEARAKMQRSRDLIERSVAEGTAIYGVTTGIGEFARIRISTEQSAELQRRIIYSHSAGTGDPQPQDVVRAAMTCRALGWNDEAAALPKTTPGFADVPTTSSYWAPATYLKVLGIVQGYPDPSLPEGVTYLRVDEPIKRAHVAVILCRVLDEAGQ